MKLTTSKWLAYTFIVGLMPMSMRLLSWTVTTTGQLAPFATQDIMAFGLVIHVSIINELEHIRRRDKGWKTIQNGTTVLFVSLYGALYTLSIVGERIGGFVNTDNILYISSVLAATSALLCQATFHHLSR
ncbi:hypothetical protein ABT364_02160 [Massilia sp. SR12]